MNCLRTIKIRSTPSFRGEVNPEAPWRKILLHVKEVYKVLTKIFYNAKFIMSFASSSALLLDDYTGRIAKELWWTNDEFFPVNIHPQWFSMLIYHLGAGGGWTTGPLLAAVQGHSLTLLTWSSSIYSLNNAKSSLVTLKHTANALFMRLRSSSHLILSLWDWIALKVVLCHIVLRRYALRWQ
jgi:hypothetical protein